MLPSFAAAICLVRIYLASCHADIGLKTCTPLVAMLLYLINHLGTQHSLLCPLCSCLVHLDMPCSHEATTGYDPVTAPSVQRQGHGSPATGMDHTRLPRLLVCGLITGALRGESSLSYRPTLGWTPLSQKVCISLRWLPNLETYNATWDGMLLCLLIAIYPPPWPAHLDCPTPEITHPTCGPRNQKQKGKSVLSKSFVVLFFWRGLQTKKMTESELKPKRRQDRQ